MPIYFRPVTYELPLSLDTIGNQWLQEPTRRDYGYPLYHWLQTATGCGAIRINDTELELKEGEGVLIAPYVPHAYTKKSDTWTTSFATFEGSLAEDIYKIIGKEPFIFIDANQGRYYKNWVNQVINSYTSQQLDAITLSTECYNFFLHFTNIYKVNKLHSNPLYKQYVEPVIKEIETKYSEPITVQALASFVYISPQYLSRLFHRFTGSSVYTYLTNYRMNKAKELLISNLYLDVQQIHYRVGYNDVSHFIATFKKNTGYTPFEFRKMYGIISGL